MALFSATPVLTI